MKFKNLLICSLLSAGMVGCGGGSQSLDAGTAPQAVQRMLSGGAESFVQTDVKQTSVVSIAGYRDNYTIVKDQTTNVVTATSKIDNSVTAYQNPSLIKFVDKWVSFDIDGTAGQVYRLYQAAFNRKPDLPGLGFWIKANQNGRAIIDIASDFVASAEFKTMYGDRPANLKLVNAFYNNVLHRDGEQAGLDWWVGQMNNGAATYGVLYGFSDSAENKLNLAAGMWNGFDYIPFHADGPKVPQATSYANAKDIGLAPQSVPVEAGGMPQDGFAYFHAYGFADFFRDGQNTLVTSSTEYLNDPNATPSNARPGHIKFWRKDSNGNWVNHTQEILADDTGCLLARKVVIADFNGDGRPDVFFSCSGFDAEPFPGEHPRILLSQLDGSYQNKVMDFNCYCHGAAAADFDHNGYADIVVGDFLMGKGAYFLKNNKDGTFSIDDTRLPASIKYKGAIFSVEVVDMNGDGKLDVWLAGNEKDWPTSFFANDGTDSFVNAKQIIMPVDTRFAAPLDLVVSDGYAYVLRSDSAVTGAAIQKVNLASMASSVIYTNTDYYPGQPLKWVDWITIHGDSIVGLNAVFGLSVKK